MDHPVYPFILYQLLNLIAKLSVQESEDVYSVLGFRQIFTMALGMSLSTLHVSSSLPLEQGQ